MTARFGKILRFMDLDQDAIDLLELYLRKTDNRPNAYIDFHLFMAYNAVAVNLYKDDRASESERNHLKTFSWVLGV